MDTFITRHYVYAYAYMAPPSDRRGLEWMNGTHCISNWSPFTIVHFNCTINMSDKVRVCCFQSLLRLLLRFHSLFQVSTLYVFVHQRVHFCYRTCLLTLFGVSFFSNLESGRKRPYTYTQPDKFLYMDVHAHCALIKVKVQLVKDAHTHPQASQLLAWSRNVQYCQGRQKKV